MLSDDRLEEMAQQLVGVPGVLGVMLGGSRARGDHVPDSDVDLGLYYRPPLDVAALGDLARQVAGPAAAVTRPGEWGSWVDGGGWLDVDGVAVDWLYRDLDRVHRSWADARAGRVELHHQVGHPLGVPGFAYAGEVALGTVLADPTGELTLLQGQARQYPAALGQGLVDRLWEARICVADARKAVSRGDTAYVAGCLFVAVELCAHAVHGRAGRWLVHEKGAVASAGRLPGAPRDFATRAHRVLARPGETPEDLAAAVAAASRLVDDVSAACASTSSDP